MLYALAHRLSVCTLDASTPNPNSHSRPINPTPTHPQLANVLSSEALFYTCIIPFIIFFGSFAGLMYPMRDILHPTGE